MVNRDRVNEVYYGNIFDKEMQRLLRERIHWICQNTRGKKVLDIGCSQGITSILLGRERFNVVGIDAERDAIDYAKNELLREEMDVQKCVRFIHANALSYKVGENLYDTVIMAEVIEHLNQPERLYQNIWPALKNKATVIITTPFGINDYFDHKKTYYLLDLLHETNAFFSLITLKIMGKWICLIFEKRESIVKTRIAGIKLEFLSVVEEAFLRIERRLLDEISLEKEKVKQLTKELRMLII